MYKKWPLFVTIAINEPGYPMVRKMEPTSLLKDALEIKHQCWCEAALFLIPSALNGGIVSATLASVALFLQDQRRLDNPVIKCCYKISFQYLSQHGIPYQQQGALDAAIVFLHNYTELKNSVPNNTVAKKLITHGIYVAKDIIIADMRTSPTSTMTTLMEKTRSSFNEDEKRYILNKGKKTWKNVYESGRLMGYYVNYSSGKSLCTAWHKQWLKDKNTAPSASNDLTSINAAATFSST
ncbi:hypothetical protein BCR42DRAFT_398868 [Absidia repens]|uniref:Uncharacterized protein n=1 Tax=Absidia repens TaxID=90262 RepID=A0A1X2HR57_9FUNG|nr:hypothetical protein BCR42DRAFT_398868 [Absidia repens]